MFSISLTVELEPKAILTGKKTGKRKRQDMAVVEILNKQVIKYKESYKDIVIITIVNTSSCALYLHHGIWLHSILRH